MLTTMNLIISLLSGFLTALIGITPPGLLNMTAAKVNLKEGKEMPLGSFSSSDNHFFKPTSDIVCSCDRYRPDIVILLREVGFILTVYFCF
jgi:hypothetical protein